MAKARFEITRFPTVLCTKIMTVTPVLGDESLEMFILPPSLLAEGVDNPHTDWEP